MLDRIPENVDFIVSEGGEAQAADVVIVCLGHPGDWEEALRVRRVPRDKIRGVAGSFVRDEGRQNFVDGIPVFDSTRAEDRKTLTQRILEAALLQPELDDSKAN